jgi:tetratricopeptide repeat protein 21B
VEGIRDLKAIPEHPTISLSVFLALMYAHHKCKPSDKETVHELESAFKKERKSSSEKSLFYASMVFWLTGRHDRARDYVDKCLKFSYSAKNLALRGWVDLTTGKDAYITQSLKFFDDAYKICESPSLTLILGKAHYYYVKKEYSESLDILNNGLASSWLSITLSLEKLKVQVASEEWDLALETARKCLSLDVHCIKAIQIIALEQCVRQGNMNEVAHTLAKLIEQIDESEPHGYKIYLSSARTFLRLCGSHHLVLRQCLTLLERSYSVKNSIEAITEQAYLNIILGNFSHALSIYKNCLSVDQGNIPALLGMVHCMLKINRTKEATQQLEFLNELQASSKTAVTLCYFLAFIYCYLVSFVS